MENKQEVVLWVNWMRTDSHPFLFVRVALFLVCALCGILELPFFETALRPVFAHRRCYMIYLEQDHLLIRDMEQADAQTITDGEIAQGWDQSVEKYHLRLRDQQSGIAISLVAVFEGHVAGYVNVYPHSERGPFAHQGIPEIVDFGVLEKYRCHGIGSRLMDVAEAVAGRYADRVYLGVGLHRGYGSAQRLYVKRGYIPDGTGLWYEGVPCTPYAACTNDDDLVLYLSKQLR